MPRIPQRVKACRALQLTDRFEPTVRIKQCLPKNLTLEKTIACLRTNQSEDAQFICANYDRLSEDLRVAIDIDYLIAAAHCKDVYKVLGLITESYHRVRGMETQLIAADESPAIMRNVTRFAKERKGFNHAKMVLQSTGSVPVPRNQVNYLIGNKVETNQQVNLSIPSHLDVASTVNEVMVELSPKEDVPRTDHSGEEEGAGEEDQEDAD